MRRFLMTLGMLVTVSLAASSCGNPGQSDIDRVRPDVERIVAELPTPSGLIRLGDKIVEPNNKSLQEQQGAVSISYRVSDELGSVDAVVASVDSHFASLGFERLAGPLPFRCSDDGLFRDAYFGNAEVSFGVRMSRPASVSISFSWTSEGPMAKAALNMTRVDKPFSCL